MITLISSDAPSAAPALFDPASLAWLSYGALRDSIFAAGSLVSDTPHGLAAVWADGSLNATIIYLGAWEAGAVVMPIDPAWPSVWQRRVIDAYEPDWLLGSPAVDEVREGYEPTSHPSCWRRATASPDSIHPDVALLLSTSGSTGSPKQVVLSRRNVLANAEAIAQALCLEPNARAIVTLPLHYSYGLSVLHSHLAAGSSVVLNPFGVIEREFWDLCGVTGANTMPGVPVTYAMLKRVAAMLERSAIRTLTQAGGRLPEPEVLFWHEATVRLGGRLFVMYGQTEATARIAVLDPRDLPAKVGAVGRAIRGGRLEIGPSTSEVFYEGPNVMMGYAQSRRDLALGDTMQGRLATGDLGSIDADGCLRIHGRSARVVKIDGRRMSLDDIEALLGQDAPVAALQDGDGVLIIYEGDRDASREAELRQSAARLLQIRGPAIRLASVAVIPRVTSGKIDYAQLGRERS